jgi:putative endonuclease
MDLTTRLAAGGHPCPSPARSTTSSPSASPIRRSSSTTSPPRSPAPRATQALGDYGERLAARYLREIGLVVLDRNWRCVRGELDIVAREGPALVICEVKTRSGEGFGAPYEAVTWRKQRRLRLLGGLWRDDHPEQAAGPLRIDVISILRPAGQAPRLQHLRAAC